MNANKLGNSIFAGVVSFGVVVLAFMLFVGILLAVTCCSPKAALVNTSDAQEVVVTHISSETHSLPASVDDFQQVNQFELPDISTDGVVIDGKLTKSGGVCIFNGRTECWYSQKVVPNADLDIPGRTVDKYGLVRDERNFLVLASSDYPYGSIVQTSLGVGKVYDIQCASGIINIYTDW